MTREQRITDCINAIRRSCDAIESAQLKRDRPVKRIDYLAEEILTFARAHGKPFARADIPWEGAPNRLSRLLADLVDAGKLTKTGNVRWTRYSLPSEEV